MPAIVWSMTGYSYHGKSICKFHSEFWRCQGKQYVFFLDEWDDLFVKWHDPSFSSFCLYAAFEILLIHINLYSFVGRYPETAVYHDKDVPEDGVFP